VTDTTVRAALSSAVSDVLERMFFLDTLGEATGPPEGADTVTVQVTFEGDPPGSFRMRLDRLAATSIAADFLGEDADSLTRAQIAEVTLELANMICGSVLSRIESSASFRLGTPAIVMDALRGQNGEETRYTVETGSGALTVAIQMETRTCRSTPQSAS
jgi:CheY-specific phosphatase CheX